MPPRTPVSDHFTFLCLALCRSCMSSRGSYERVHAKAFHTCKTMFNDPVPIVQLLDSFCPLSHNFWGLGEGHGQPACYSTSLRGNRLTVAAVVCPLVQPWCMSLTEVTT